MENSTWPDLMLKTMTEVFIIADNIYSPLGATAAENFMQLKKSVSGIKEHTNTTMSAAPFYAALFDKNTFLKDDTGNGYTTFEKLLIASITDALKGTEVNPADPVTAIILSSTKGNISLLETAVADTALQQRISLNSSAKLVASHFNFINRPIVISNACISGLLAIITGMRLIQSGQYQHVVVAGADIISKFILSGFQSFQAVSNGLCKPFDAARKGINLGEGAGTVILSSTKRNATDIKVLAGSISNDANHISGPSRTGEELNNAITKAMKDAGLSAADIDFISAHGTATIFNDEMEAKAITLANLQQVPVNSLKAYYGHTLGAAGLIESVVAIHSLKEDTVLPTLGFSEMGVPTPVNVCTSLQQQPIKNCLKTASGFGGCNAAVIFGKQ
jgi:3-oxoacyl-[acyl-carrier-protein] synthase-1